MAQRYFTILIVLSAVLFFCCSDDDRVVNPTSQPLIIGDLINFDTTVPIMVQVYAPGRFPVGEPFVRQECHIAEPFIDVNGNGVYDEQMVDHFAMYMGCDSSSTSTLYCRCDSIVDSVCYGGYRVLPWDTASGWDFTIEYPHCSHDLNRNGMYDPVCSIVKGLPYDDFDGDDEQDFQEFSRYVPGLPFADLNGNGIYDQEPQDISYIEQFSLQSLDPWDRYASISIGPLDIPHYRYVSELGIEYIMYGHDFRYHSITEGYFRFVLDSAGFWYSGFANQKLLIFAGPEVHPHALEEIQISETVTETRSITFGESLDIRDRSYSGLVCVDIPRVYSNGDTLQSLEMEARFYFSPNELHLIAARLYPPRQDSVWIFLDQRLDTLPLPMIR